MEIINSDTFDLSTIKDVELVAEYTKTLKKIKELYEKKSHLEYQATKLMELKGSKVLIGDSKELKKRVTPNYDKSRLTPLKEKINYEDLIRKKAIIPRWTEEVVHEEQWGNMNVIKRLGEYGIEIQEIIDSSLVEKTIRFELKDRR
tara:strand:- start:704 stop:1141 length:438 start_codon:yes stop_codon:yes gene_type:complete